MNAQKEFKEIKEIYKKILKAKYIEKYPKEIQTLCAIDISFSANKVYCTAAVFDYQTLEILETKTLATKEVVSYSQLNNPFREATPIIETYKLLKTKPDLILLPKQGIINPNIVSTGAYVGVLLNKQVVCISQNITQGRLEVDKIMFKDKQVGIAIKSKEHSKPIYITTGFGITIDKSLEIVEHCLKGHKLPAPLHIAHKITNKTKKEVRERR